MRIFLLVAISALGLAACTELTITNEPPEARIVATSSVDDANLPPVPTSRLYEVSGATTGATINVTLDASSSSDPEGTSLTYEWFDTTYAGPGPDGGAAPEPFTDLGTGATASVTLGLGTWRFSLWVTDADGVIGEPFTMTIVVQEPSLFEPDEACVAKYKHSNPLCIQCACQPNAIGGCLDEINTCYDTPSLMGLCQKVIDCAGRVACAGSGCYNATLCMAEIDEAAAGNLGACNDPAVDPTENACRASAVIAPCETGTEEMPAACREYCLL